MVPKNDVVADIVQLYKRSGKSLKLSPRHTEAFECRYGILDGKFYTRKEIGARLEIGSSRVDQLLARVEHELRVINS